MRPAIVVALGLLTSSAYAQLEQTDRVEAMMIATNREAGGLPLVEERLQVTIDGQHATSTLLQVYENRSEVTTEGRYRLRPGLGSHVDGFAYWNGEQKIVGEVFEKQVAHQVYDRVTTRRRDPGLLEQDGEGAFSFKVFPIAAHEKKRIELHWTKWLERRTKTLRYRAPISRTDAEVILSIAGPVTHVTSPTHRLHVETTKTGARVRAERAHKGGELVVEWQVDEPDWQPSAYVHAVGEHDGWFAAELAAPAVDAKTVAAKDVTIVVDRSGSMTGDAMEHARSAAVDMIRRLDARDRVNVIAFSDEVDPLFAEPQTLDKQTRARAIAFASGLRAGGGTDIALALKTAIGAQDRETPRPRVVVFMTDGQSDAQTALIAARADNGDTRVFTLGLGTEVNRPLLQRVAALKRGRFVYIESASNIEREVRRLAASISKPVMVGVSVDIEGATALRVYPRTLPDLFAEDELLVTGRVRGAGPAKLVIKGTVAGKPVTLTRDLEFAGPPRPWVGRLWAQARVDHVLEELALGTADAEEMKREVIELALAYNFVTPYTAFLAIPESELGDMRGTIEAARQRKAKILADNADAAALESSGSSLAGAAGKQTASLDPAPGFDDDGEDEDARDEELAAPSEAFPGRVQKHGCAGCSTGQGGSSLVLAVFGAVFVLRRRRGR